MKPASTAPSVPSAPVSSSALPSRQKAPRKHPEFDTDMADMDLDSLPGFSNYSSFIPHDGEEEESSSSSMLGVGNREVIDEGIKKNKRKQLSRWDFETEEEWIQYKEGQTPMPKAAFQFGVKQDSGRKSSKSLTKNQKFGRELQQIQKLMKDKYGMEVSGSDEGSRKKQRKE
ncbi:RED-like protein C-terminal region-domain-containing protein [Paraphysoderma sedebokerense]|nr:RED-like protein C-terminal region-domain-containing protein [Paraphysoderma sedebokerense]